MRALAALPLAALVLGGCAKLPKNGAGYGYTLLSFHITMNGAVNPDYIYAVAIRPLTQAQYSSAATDNLGPGPVVNVGTKNGIVTGRPTRLILWSPNSSQTGYLNYRFANPPTDASDPDPGTYSSPSEVITGSNPTTSGDPNSLDFEISTQDLVDDGTTTSASQIVAIQFNILTMNQTALNSSTINSRVFDALGDQSNLSSNSFTSPRTVLITTSGRYDNTGRDGGQPSSIAEPADDVYNAPGNRYDPIDIVDWYLDVKTS